MSLIQIRDGFPEQRQIILDEDQVKLSETTPLIRNCMVTDIGHFPKTHYHLVERARACDQHILIANIQGNGWFRTSEQLWEVPPLHIVIIPKGTVHAYGAEDSVPWNIYWMHFRGSIADEFVALVEKQFAGLVFELSGMELLIESFEAAIRYHMAEPSIGNLAYRYVCAQKILTDSIALGLGPNRSRSKLVEGRILKSIRHMQSAINQNLSLEELSSVAGLSPSHYSNLFRSHTGSSPLRFFTRLRMQKASELLETTDLPIQNIAYKLGYEDTFYFARTFKKLNEITPSTYRKSVRRASSDLQ